MGSRSRGSEIDSAAVWELRDALSAVARDEAARALVLTANGAAGKSAVFSPGFSAGVLPDLLAERPDEQPPQLLGALRIPTVAALFGRVSGAALELALACDLRLAADDVSLALPQLAEGSFPCWGGTQRLSRIVGIGRAIEMVMLGDPLDAAAALASGLVTRLVPRQALLSETEKLTEAWLRSAPHALSYAKEAVRSGADLSFDRGLRLEWDLAVLLETTTDRAEGIRAFLEKRPPNFKGE